MKGPRRRPGRINGAWMAFHASVIVFAGLIGLLILGGPGQVVSHLGQQTQKPLIVYCAAGIKPPVEACAEEFEKEYGVAVQLQYGGSQTLLANIQASRRGDLYLPADESYVDVARNRGLSAETIPLAEMALVLAVHKDNPKKIGSLPALLRDDVKLAQANPEAAAVGKVTRDVLRKTGDWETIEKKTTVIKMTVNDVANDIRVGAVDAGFVWDATLKQYPDLKQVDVPQLATGVSSISITVLKQSEQPTAALRFARYLAAKDRGAKEFARFGYRSVEGDAWSTSPTINLFAGAMLRPAIEETIQQFEQREGCRVNRIYNGCGILVGEMKKGIGAMPDAYFSCDSSFMAQVKDLFLDGSDISSNQLVIMVHKGNPRGIKSLKDLGKPGLKIGVGHEKQCALGALTATTLNEAGQYTQVRRNVAVESPTGDMLVNQLRTGSLDAVIAYISNAASSGDLLEAIAIDIPCATATQPMAVSKDSANKQITMRLMDAIKSQESRKRFTAYGFGWKVDHR